MDINNDDDREQLVASARNYLTTDQESCSSGWLYGNEGRNNYYEQDYDHLFHMLKKYPELAKFRYGGWSAFPLVYLVVSKAPLAMIKEVYDMHPDAVNSTRPEDEICALRETLRGCRSVEDIEFLVSKCPGGVFGDCGQLVDSEGMLEDSETPMELLLECENNGIDHVYEKARLLVDADPKSITATGYHGLSLLDLAVSNIEGEAPAWFAAWLGKHWPQNQAELNLASTSCSLRKSNFLQLKSFLTTLNVPTGGRFILQVGECKLDPEFLDLLLSDSDIPPFELQLDYFDFSKEVPKTTLDRCKSPMQKFDICNSTLNSKELDFLLQNTSASLKEIEVSGPSKDGEDYTEVVKKILQNVNLDSFCLYGLEMNVEQVELFLEEQNTKTPCLGYTVFEEGTFHPNTNLLYLSLLNHYGRAKLGPLNATQRLLIESLSSVESDDVVPVRLKTFLPHGFLECLNTSLSYGLLREAPGLWTTSTEAHNKRPTCGALEHPGQKRARGAC